MIYGFAYQLIDQFIDMWRSPEKETVTQAKIKSFGNLEEGWDFGVGGPAPSHVIRAALLFCSLGERMGFKMDAFPGAGGDIGVDFCLKDELVEIVVKTDLSLELVHEAGIGSDYEELACFENAQIDDIIEYLKKFQVRGYVCPWISSEHSTVKNIKKDTCDFIQTASRNPILMLESPLSKSSVFSPLEPICANISNVITSLSRTANPLPIGVLENRT